MMSSSRLYLKAVKMEQQLFNKPDKLKKLEEAHWFTVVPNAWETSDPSSSSKSATMMKFGSVLSKLF